ncbi:MAG: DNA (cytosine-5-)-methyltransferase [bacterium]|nr:DNA (cytosine-5-)-methyltransferase [bacterium]
MKFVELFAGIGGFSLGFERAGHECVGHVEIDKYAQKVLLKHWPEVPVYSDVKEIKGDEFGKVDILCGGFPCQDLSVAGKQKGIHGDRSGLFDQIIRISRVCRPKYIVLENVANLIARPEWFGYVLGRIAEIGYDAEWQVIRADTFGSPQGRPRIFIAAYPTGKQWNTRQVHTSPNEKSTLTTPKNWDKFWYVNRGSNNVEFRKKDEPFICGVDDGIPHRVDRLKCLGNALIPQIAEYIGRQLK